MLRMLAVLACLAVLSGCTEYKMRAAESSGRVRVEPSPIATADYRVTLAWIPDPEERAEMTRRLLAVECPRFDVIDERTIVTGHAMLTGEPFTTHIADVKCRR